MNWGVSCKTNKKFTRLGGIIIPVYSPPSPPQMSGDSGDGERAQATPHA